MTIKIPKKTGLEQPPVVLENWNNPQLFSKVAPLQDPFSVTRQGLFTKLTSNHCDLNTKL